MANGVDERGVLTQYYGSKALDASLLLAPLVRFLPADDPIIRATVLAIADELTVHELVLRYRVEETDDGFTGEEGALRSVPSGWSRHCVRSVSTSEPGSSVQAAVFRRHT